MSDAPKSELRAIESAGLTIALAQVQRGEFPSPKVATMCVLALARLEGLHDWTEEPNDE